MKGSFPPRAALGAGIFVAALAGCSGDPPTLVAWFSPARVLAELPAGGGSGPGMPGMIDRAELVGSWDGWHRPGRTDWQALRAADGTVWRRIELALPPGRYAYAVLVDDTYFTDENNPQTTFIPDPRSPAAGPFSLEVSEVVIADDHLPHIDLSTITVGADGSLALVGRFVAGRGGPALDLQSVAVVVRRGQDDVPAAAPTVDADGGLRLTLSGLDPGKYTVEVSARDGRGQPTLARASAFVAPAGRTPPADLGDGVIYQLMIDRFWGDAGALDPPASPGDRAGGTLRGVRDRLEAGYFERLGVTTLWLSPLYQNPPGRQIGRDGHLYEPYHGYWPADPRAVSRELGGEGALDELVRAAHARGLRVIADAVPNHVADQHPYYRDHSRTALVAAGADPSASWFNDGDVCVCGDPGCDWDGHIETCWFGPYLPDLNWRNPAVADQGVSDLGFWIARFDLDGLRIDAVPMMPRSATRQIVRMARGAVSRRDADFLLLGEDYTGAGAAGLSELAAYLGRDLDGLDSEFDFPLMWALRYALARGEGSLADLEQAITASQGAFVGSGAIMAHMIDNHDTTRFLSEAAGDAGGDPWVKPAAQPSGREPYQRLLLAETVVFSLPGIPVIYYGDEVGVAGAGDPDSRRVLPDPAKLSATQAWLSDAVARLGRARRCLKVMRHGRRDVLFLDADREVVRLSDETGVAEPVVVALSRASAASTLTMSGVPAGSYQDLISGTGWASTGPGAQLPIGGLSAAVLVQEGSACAR
jgi:glycosidase